MFTLNIIIILFEIVKRTKNCNFEGKNYENPFTKISKA